MLKISENKIENFRNIVKFCVKSVITKYNDSIEEVGNLISYLLKFNNLEYVSLAPGEYNVFSDFNAFRSTKDKLNFLQENVRGLNHPKVSMQEYSQLISEDITFEEKVVEFNARALCSGNHSTFLILPDGKVTICEQTYWNPVFIFR